MGAFLMPVPAESAGSVPMTAVIDWPVGLRSKRVSFWATYFSLARSSAVVNRSTPTPSKSLSFDQTARWE
jgi:hypothetical protein